MIGERCNGLLGADGGAGQNAAVIGQMRAQEIGDLYGLFDAPGGKFAGMIRCPVYSFRVSPQNQIHPAPEYYILFASVYRIHCLCYFNLKEMT